MKKRINIEKLLKWAYCEELPKGEASGRDGPFSSWDAVTSIGELGAWIDENRYGVVPDLMSAGEPDPDAITVHATVATLDSCTFDLPDDWNPMPELLQFDDLATLALSAAKKKLFLTQSNGRMSWRRPPSQLIRQHAILGGAPDGYGDVPEREPLRGPNGGELWFRMRKQVIDTLDGKGREFSYEADDGWDLKRKVPKRGAYRKFHLVPDPVNALVARQEYVLWLECLNALAVRLTRTLSGFGIEKSARPVMPWRCSQRSLQARQHAVLPDLKFFS
ncbi:hypothetical protein [Labrenzia sp. DG1229]|uniref:hypothetical protein n=1 Tax=Labrenzia sp. DG1229 TaxID=681847 RepID=UPI00048ED536|nr:hypothetical protein [Labrenzia sp. DG1229]